jgi:hypothetical protein
MAFGDLWQPKEMLIRKLRRVLTGAGKGEEVILAEF